MNSFFQIICIVLFIFSKANALDFKEIKPGIFLHMGKHEEIDHHNQGDICNISFIVGKDSVLVIDSGASDKIANEVQDKIKKVICELHGNPQKPKHKFLNNNYLNFVKKLKIIDPEEKWFFYHH